MQNKRLSILVNILIFLLVLISGLSILFDWTQGVRLTSAGFSSMKYFTVLSNQLAGLAAAIYLVCLLRNRVPTWVILLKYMAAASVGLTFLTVMLFLGPLYGYGAMLRGVNLPLHCIVPVIAMAEFVFLVHAPILRRTDALLAAAPMLLYGAVYMCNILLNGVGKWPDTNDWYSFCLWGLPVGFGIFAALFLVTCGLARLLALGNRKAHRVRV